MNDRAARVPLPDPSDRTDGTIIALWLSMFLSSLVFVRFVRKRLESCREKIAPFGRVSLSIIRRLIKVPFMPGQ